MQRSISGASELCDDSLQIRFSLLSFTVGSIEASARDSGTGKCLRGHKPKTFFFCLFLVSCVMHTSKGHLTADRSGHGVLDTLNASMCGFRIQFCIQMDDADPQTQLSRGENYK